MTVYLIDSSILAPLVLGLTHPGYLALSRRTPMREKQFYQVKKLLDDADRLAVTQAVLAETSNLFGKLYGEERNAVFATFRGLCANAVEVSKATIQVMDAPEFVRLGVTDCVLLAALSEEFVLLSADGNLCAAASRAGHEVMHFPLQTPQ